MYLFLISAKTCNLFVSIRVHRTMHLCNKPFVCKKEQILISLYNYTINKPIVKHPFFSNLLNCNLHNLHQSLLISSLNHFVTCLLKLFIYTYLHENAAFLLSYKKTNFALKRYFFMANAFTFYTKAAFGQF